jgi:hypothetical protein
MKQAATQLCQLFLPNISWLSTIYVVLHPGACLLSASCWFLAWLTLQPWRMKWHISPKHHLTFNGLHSIISWKVEHFITAAVRTSDPTCYTRNLLFPSFLKSLAFMQFHQSHPILHSCHLSQLQCLHNSHPLSHTFMVTANTSIFFLILPSIHFIRYMALSST